MSQPQTQAPSQDAAAAPSNRSSSRSGDERSRISNIEKSVTHLLHATKTLLEVLTRWSKHSATENEVSDVYVRLGYEFNIACRAFNQIGVDTQDLGPVPDLLRAILEETLSGEPSQAHLDRYLPRIRDIIVNLLQGLKKKQQKLRQRQVKDSGTSSSSASSTNPASDSRQSSSTIPNRTTSDPSVSNPPSYQRQRSYDDSVGQNGNSLNSRYSSVSSDRRSPSRDASTKSVPQSATADTADFAFASPPSGTGPAQDVLTVVSPPYPQESSIPDQSPPDRAQSPPSSSTAAQAATLHPKGDALAQLQRGGELERRASRRFSAYQIGKHLGTSSSGIPLIPPTQNSPIPNRGRDVRESMNAVRVRGNQPYNRDLQRKATSDSPSRLTTNKTASPVEAPVATATSGPIFEMPAEAPGAAGSPYAITPDDKLAKQFIELDDTSAKKNDDSESATAVPETATAAAETASSTNDPGVTPTDLDRSESVNIPVRSSSRTQAPTHDSRKSDAQSERRASAKELTLFLQYKTRIKKFVLTDGYDELSIARLQLGFIEKFSWNTTSNGVDLPEIYLQDPVSGVRYELEDLSDVKNHSVLVLNVDAVEEVKKHLDDGIGGLKNIVQDLRNNMADQQVALQRVSDKQQDTTKEITRLATLPSTSARATSTSSPISTDRAVSSLSRAEASNHLGEVQSLRRDLAVMRQTYTSWLTDMKNSMKTLQDKANTVKSLASSQPTFPSASEVDSSSAINGRSYVNNGRKTLNSTSEGLMNRVEELQDIVEDLRKDVVTRGVRPLPRQLETVTKELGVSMADLKKLKDFIKREKPTWTKIWKDELQVVCDDQNLLTMQEELCSDLEADLEAVSQTFALVEEATKQQNLMSPSSSSDTVAAGAGRSLSRTLNPAADPAKAKDGVLDEVRALQPNHETRLEAIERAEKLRQRELENRKEGEFQKELSGFVDEGRLKKSGGVEEAERIRKVKDDMARKEFWERLNGGKPVGGPSPVGTPGPESQNQLQLDGDAIRPPPLEIPSEPADTGTITPDSRFVDAPEVPLPSSAT